MKSIFFLAVFFLTATAVHASQQSGKVNSLHVRENDGLVYVVLEGTNRTAKPSCAAGNYFIVRSEASNAGRLQIAVILAAKSSGKTIVIAGSGTCTRWSDGEDIVTVTIAD